MKNELENAPADVKRLYDDALAMAETQGQSKPEAKKYAFRHVQLAGWYRTAGGWKRVAPDVRDKVNVRQATEQPDGRYLITDVDCFYPNATKGSEWIFDDKKIDRVSKNTNRMIAAGGQRPALVEGHQHPIIKLTGLQQDSLGSAINWRKHPTKAGWARCDLVDVSPETVNRMRDRKLTGLSAELSRDAAGLNQRFSRVSLLGGTLQSLSYLPVTEVYSVQNQLCFSADEVFSSRGQAHQIRKFPMDKSQAKEMAECFSALSAAHASFAAGEEGADSKLKEAQEAHDACKAKYSTTAEPTTEDEPTETPSEEMATTYSVGEVTPEQMAADPTGVLLAFQSEIHRLSTKSKQQEAVQAAALAATKKATARKTFDKFLGDLHGKGHVFDDTEAVAMFEAAGDDTARMTALSSFLKKTPTKKETGPADIAAIFSAEDVAPGQIKKDPVTDKPAPFNASSLSFSSEAAEAGATAADIVAGATK